MQKAKKIFSKTFRNSLIKAEIIRQMAIADGWSGIDDCLERAPQALDILMRHADAALCAMQAMEKKKGRASASGI